MFARNNSNATTSAKRGSSPEKREGDLVCFSTADVIEVRLPQWPLGFWRARL
jgi:hypothetical protein